jgi:hypothetical protein
LRSPPANWAVCRSRELVSALVERLELPLTEAKLATVTVADLQLLLQGDDVVESEVPREQLKQAVRLLWGEGIANRDLPPVASYAEGDMPGSIRVACASNREQCSTATSGPASASWSTRCRRTKCG